MLSISTTTTIGILAGSALAAAVPGANPARLVTAAATLSVLVGVVLMAGAALRFGFVANFISEPVLAGFKAGIGRARGRPVPANVGGDANVRRVARVDGTKVPSIGGARVGHTPRVS